jgi:hypothetical protein
MTAAGGGEKWRWADPKGVQTAVHSDELRAALASGALPPYTLVWRPGMKEWEPAYQVADLATFATPEQPGAVANIPPPPMTVVAVQAQFEKRDAEVDDPSSPRAPPPPVHRYAAIAAAVPAHVTRAIQTAQAASARAAGMKRARPGRAARASLAKPADDELETWVAKPASTRATEPKEETLPPTGPPSSLSLSAPPPPPRRSHAAPASAGGGGPPSALPHVPLPVMHTADIGSDSPTLVTRPAAHSSDPSRVRDFQESSTSAANNRVVEGARPSPDASAGELPSFPFDDLDVEEPQPPGSARLPSYVAPSSARPGPDLSDRVKRLGRALAARLRPRAGRTQKLPGAPELPRERQDPRLLLGLGGGALALLVLVAVAALGATRKPVSPDSSSGPSGPLSASDPAPGPETMPPPHKAVAVARERLAAPAPEACRIAGAAARLASKAWKDAPIELRVGPGENVRLGFASDAFSAQGISFALDSLIPTLELATRTGGRIRAVVPLPTAERGFAISIDGKGDRLHAGYPVSAEPPLVVGWADGAIAVASRSTDGPRPVWSMEGDEAPDAFRAAEGKDGGVAVVFRRKGAIFGGWIDREQRSRGPLLQVAGAGGPPGALVGSPVLATNGEAVAVAFADREAPNLPWSIWVGASPLSTLPKQAVRFDIPPGGPGGSAFAPALAGLADGRWLLAWTEGGGGNHDVRAQTLGPDLAPTGAPLTLSDPQGNAGQAAVAVSEGQGAMAYLSLTGHGYEVWGVRIDCR